MMRKRWIILLAALCLLVLFAGCARQAADPVSNAASKPEQTQQTEPAAVPEEPEQPVETETPAEPEEPEEPGAPVYEAQKEGFSVFLYKDPAWESYQSLTDVRTLELADTVSGGDAIRFVCTANDVEITLEAVEFDLLLMDLQCLSSTPVVCTEAGVAYEFRAAVGETMPSYRLVARKDGYTAVSALVWDGSGEQDEVYLVGERDRYDYPVFGDETIVDLCRLYAMKSVFAGAALNTLPEFYWDTVGEALNYRNAMFNDVDPGAALRYRYSERQFAAVAAALFPEMEAPDIQAWDIVAPIDGGYEVSAVIPEVDVFTKFLYTEETEGNEVRVVVSVEWPEGFDQAYCVTITPLDLTQPIGWKIVGFEEIPSVG